MERQFAKAATLSRRRRRSRFQMCLHNDFSRSRRRRRRQSVINRFADSRTEVIEPFLRMVSVHDTPNESKLGRNVAAVPADVIACCRGIALHEFPDVRGPGEYVGGVAQLRNLGHHGAPQLENELAAKQEDVDTALLQLGSW